MAINTNINKRGVPGYDVQDPGAIANLEYNNASGSKKVSEVGRHLKPIFTNGSYTTNLSTATALPGMGKNFAIYNNSGTVASITFGEDNTVTSLAAGATDTNGHVGIALMPNAWTYVAGGYQNWAITSGSTVLVYLIEDSSQIKFQSKQTATV